MTTHNLSFSTLVLSFLLSTVFTANVDAHDDGLTCHEHPCTENYPGGACWDGYFRDENGDDTIDYQTSGQSLIALGALIHRFDHLVALSVSAYDPTVVRQLRAAFTELRQNIFIVLSLLNRSESAVDSKESEGLHQAALIVYNTTELSLLAEFRDIYSAIREDHHFILELKDVTLYLSRRYGLPDKILVALEDAAASC
ncbi:MAG: hypothetical protein ABW139_11820 [Candidatus Thiodiazotropha sp. DIVDIV]